MKLFNLWNAIRYTAYAPLYNLTVIMLDDARKKALSLLNYSDEEKVLLIGCGSGKDLLYLPKGPTYYLTDITPLMLLRAETLAKQLGHNFVIGNCSGDKLPFENSYFDKVILNLIVTVIPDPVECLNESKRVLVDDGRILVFDKFLAKGAVPSIGRKLLNAITTFFFSSITRQIEILCEQTSLHILEDHPLYMGHAFRGLILKK
jgi:phosphatidylethanolamine/phosphatidyl-N-methylethanolamine N-methyltransferase